MRMAIRATKRKMVVAARKKALRERTDLPRGTPFARIKRWEILNKEKKDAGVKDSGKS